MATLGRQPFKRSVERQTARKSVQDSTARLDQSIWMLFLSVLAMLTVLDWFHGPRNFFHGPSATATASNISSPCQPEFDSCQNFAIHIRENPQSENSVAPIGEQRRDVVRARKSSSYASGDDHSTLRLFRSTQGCHF